MSLRDRVLHVAYVLLSVLVTLRNAIINFTYSVSDVWHSQVAPHFRSLTLFRKASRNGTRRRGSTPRQPTVLGAILVLPHKGDQDDQALCRLLTWARHHGFNQVLIYDPRGEVQRRKEHLEEAIRYAEPSDSIRIWNGWKLPLDWNEFSTPQGAHSSGRNEMVPQVTQLGVALLSAADAEWPLVAAAKKTTPALMAGNTNGECVPGTESSLQAALGAPADVNCQMAAVAGPIAAREPDLVLVSKQMRLSVFGGILTLAGFPQWVVRTSELFDVGRLGELTGSKLDAVMRKFLGIRQRFGR